MNTRKQVLIMTVLLMMSLIVLGIYGAWYPSRETDAQEHFDTASAERAAIIFSTNCRLCHGDVGEGGALGGRLTAAPALDRPDLQGFDDPAVKLAEDIDEETATIPVSDGSKFKATDVILVEDERMEVTGTDGNNLRVKRGVQHTEASGHLKDASVLVRVPDLLAQKINLIRNTITCGRVGTAMQPWAQSQGGPLSDEQIRQLTLLITQARWELVEEENEIHDVVLAHLTQEVDDSSASLFVNDVTAFSAGDAIRIGGERMLITNVPTSSTIDGKTVPIAVARDKSGIVTVQRGALDTTAVPHTTDEELFKFPLAPADPSILQTSCGQTAQEPAPAGTPGLVEPFTGQTVSVVAKGIAFDLKTISVKTGGQVRIRLDNQDAATPHNIAVRRSSTDSTAAAPGSIGITFDGVAVDDTVFDIPAAGNYFFRCDVHPTIMTGTFTVTN